MSKLNWDQAGQRTYETGVDHGVLYPKASSGTGYDAGVAWNGLTGVSEKPSGAEPTAIYADNIKYLNLVSAEEFGGTIEAYTYPDEWAQCDGSASPVTGATIGQQARRAFGFCYRTRFGNDQQGSEYGYKLHLVYNALASPSERSYETINDSPDAIQFSWEFSTIPEAFTTNAYKNYKPTACLTIDSTKVTQAKMTSLENLLYGTDAEGQTAGTNPQLPTPDEVLALLAAT